MATEVEGLTIVMQASLKQFEQAFAKMRSMTVKELRTVERQAQHSATKIERSLSGIGAGIKGGLIGAIGGFGLDSIARTIKGLVDDIGKIADESARAGIDAETFQAFALTALDVGVEQEKITSLMQKFNLEIGEAATKGNDLSKILKLNGVSLTDANGKIRDTKSLFFDVVDLISNANSQQEAAVIAMAAFGKQAADALPFLQQGSKAIKDGEQAARAAGGVLSNELVAAADEFSDRWARTWALWKAQGARSILTIIDLLADIDESGGAEKTGQKFFEGFKSREQAIRRKQLKEERKELQKNIDFARKTDTGLPLLAGWVERLEEINLLLNVIGPKFEAIGRGTSDARAQVISRNPFDIQRGTIIPNKEADEEAKRRRLAAEKAERDADREQDRIDKMVDKAIKDHERLEDQYDKTFNSIEKQTAALDLETLSLGLTAEQAARLRIQEQLLNYVREAGIKLTPEIIADIDDVAAAYGRAVARNEQAVKQAKMIGEIQDDVKSSFKGFFSDISNGVTPIDALTSALGRLQDKLMDLALNSIFDQLVGTKGGGLGALLAGLFSGSSESGIGGALVKSGIYHRGGIAGYPSQTKMVPSSAFKDAPKFHMGGDVPAILQRGEKIIPRGGSWGQSPTNIIIQQMPGVNIEKKSSVQQNGQNTHTLIARAVNDHLASGRGNRVMMQQFNISPAKRRS